MIGRVYLNLYEITSVLGQGSMGRVFLARQRGSGREVVLKVMHDHIARQRRFRELFEREMDCMIRFKHPHAVTLLDASLKDPNGPCLVMEYVKGADLESLRKRQSNRRFPAARIGRLVSQLCEVLQAAHSQGILHCDLKPSNLMVIDWNNPLERIKVLDFGLAKLAEASEAGQAGVRGVVAIGAPGYIAPEQLRGSTADQRSDLYSVGIILYELLAGRLPFTGTGAEVRQAHLSEMPPPFAAELGVPRAVEQVIQICLGKLPSQRPASAAELGQRFTGALGERPAAASAAAAKIAPPREIQRPSRGTLPATPRPASATMHGEYTKADVNEIIFDLNASMPAAAALARVGGFLEKLGARIVDRGSESLRALLGVDCHASHSSAPRPQPSTSGSSMHLVLTELEAQFVNRGIERQVNFTLRPMGPLSPSVSPVWRTACQRIGSDLQTCLLS